MSLQIEGLITLSRLGRHIGRWMVGGLGCRGKMQSFVELKPRSSTKLKGAPQITLRFGH